MLVLCSGHRSVVFCLFPSLNYDCFSPPPPKILTYNYNRLVMLWLSLSLKTGILGRSYHFFRLQYLGLWREDNDTLFHRMYPESSLSLKKFSGQDRSEIEPGCTSENLCYWFFEKCFRVFFFSWSTCQEHSMRHCLKATRQGPTEEVA